MQIALHRPPFQQTLPFAFPPAVPSRPTPVERTIDRVRPQVQRLVRSKDHRPVVFLDMDDVIVVGQGRDLGSLACDRCHGKDITDRLPPGMSEQGLFDALTTPAIRSQLQQLHQAADPWYVVHSGWSAYFDRTAFEDLLRRMGLPFIAERLHANWKPPHRLTSEKTCNLLWWIENNGLPRRFVILDDPFSHQGLRYKSFALSRHVVLCTTPNGLTAVELKQALDTLRNRPAW